MATCLLAFARYILSFLHFTSTSTLTIAIRAKNINLIIPSQEMIGQICNLETVEPQEILIKGAVVLAFCEKGVVEI